MKANCSSTTPDIPFINYKRTTTYLCRGYRTNSSTRYLSTLPTCNFMGTGSVLENEHFMGCCMLKGIKCRHFRSPSYLRFSFNCRNVWPVWRKLLRNLCLCKIPKHVENSSLLGCNGASSGNFLWTFQDNLSFPLHLSGIQNIFDSWILF